MPHYRFPKPYADAVARLRVPSSFLLLTAFAWLSRPSEDSLLRGIPISLAGLALRAWAAGHLAKNQRLVDSGPAFEGGEQRPAGRRRDDLVDLIC